MRVNLPTCNLAASLSMIAMTWVLSVSPSFALSLGNLEVKSSLNQSFNGLIEVFADDQQEIDSLKASLAAQEAFEELGLIYKANLENLQFSVVELEGNNYLQVTSSDFLIKEPFLHFLIKAEWSGGSAIREYTALIDPPVFADGEDIGPLTSPASTSSTQSSDSPSTISSEPVANTSTSSVSYGPVERGITLSEIAEDIANQFPGLSMFQVMEMLFNENKDSFINNNINGLLEGSVLKLSSIDAALSINVQESQQFFTEHVQQWQQSSGDSTSGVKVAQDSYLGSVSDVSESSNETTPQKTNDFQVGAGSEYETQVSSGDSAAADSKIIALQREVSELETTLESSKLENTELKERIVILESQLNDMNSLLDLGVEDTELANMETALAVRRIEDENAVGTSSTAIAENADENKIEQQSEKGKVVEVKQPAGKSFTEKISKLTQNKTLLGVIAALLLAWLGMLFVSRSKKYEEFDDDYNTIHHTETETSSDATEDEIVAFSKDGEGITENQDEDIVETEDASSDQNTEVDDLANTEDEVETTFDAPSFVKIDLDWEESEAINSDFDGDMKIEIEEAAREEVKTQYELAHVFIDLGDEVGAKKILKEIVDNKKNDKALIKDAKALLKSIKG